MVLDADHQRRPSSANTFQQPQYPRQYHAQNPNFTSAVGPNNERCEDDRNNQPQYDAHGDVLPPAMAFALGKEWLTGLCDCLKDTDSCVDTTFCPYCQLGYQYHRTRRDYVDMDAVMCLGACCGDMLVGGLGCSIATAVLRHKIVQRYRIDEGVGFLLLKGLCCAPFSACQVHREMKLRGEAPGGVCIATSRRPQPPPAMPAMGAREREAPRSVFDTTAASTSSMSFAAASTAGDNYRPSVNPYYVNNNAYANTNTGPQHHHQHQQYHHHQSHGQSHFDAAPGYQTVASGNMSNPSTPAAAVVQGTPVYPETPLSIPDTPLTAGAGATTATTAAQAKTPSTTSQSARSS